MRIVFDETKRQKMLHERGLDFADAGKIFDGPKFSQPDDRFPYPEPRFQTYGLINNRLVMVAWTPIANGIRVISMRKCNEREQEALIDHLG